MFLVGGFGSSAYLKRCLQEANSSIQIIQPHDAWSAIVKCVTTSLRAYQLANGDEGALY